MYILAFDTSTAVTSVAIAQKPPGDSGLSALSTQQDRSRRHTANIMALIDNALASAEVPIHVINAIAVGTGPGSFTGLRIGMATAKGLAFSLGVPLWGVSSLAAFAHDVVMQVAPTSKQSDLVFVPILDARRQEVFLGAYEHRQSTIHPLLPDQVVSPESVRPLLNQKLKDRPVLLFGDGVLAYPDTFHGLDTVSQPNPSRSHLKNSEEPQLQGGASTGAECIGILEHWSAGTTPRMGAHSNFEMASTPTAASVAQLAWLGDRVDILQTGGPTYIRPSEAERKFPEGNPGGTFSP